MCSIDEVKALNVTWTWPLIRSVSGGRRAAIGHVNHIDAGHCLEHVRGEARKLLRHRREAVNAALRLVGLSGFANAYPHQLSGGMAQRAALARALVNNPMLLILDEPFGQLDSLTRIAMQAELVSLWQRSSFTALLVTHDVEE